MLGEKGKGRLGNNMDAMRDPSKRFTVDKKSRQITLPRQIGFWDSCPLPWSFCFWQICFCRRRRWFHVWHGLANRVSTSKESCPSLARQWFLQVKRVRPMPSLTLCDMLSSPWVVWRRVTRAYPPPPPPEELFLFPGTCRNRPWLLIASRAPCRPLASFATANDHYQRITCLKGQKGIVCNAGICCKLM